MRWFVSLLAALAIEHASAADLMIYKMPGGAAIAVKSDGAKLELVGLFNSVTVIETTPTPTPTPNDAPTGPGQLIYVRPWSCSLDESDADLTVRESLDAARSQIPYLRLLPGTLDQRMQVHPAERYRSLARDVTRGWVFHVVPTKGTPRILNQGPMNADAVLGWVKVPKVAFAEPEVLNEAKWLDIDFEKAQQGELLGSIDLPPDLYREAMDAAVNIKSLPGFQPIPKSEWSQWTSRFPITRLVKSIRNTTEQTMGSCVGHACANGMELGTYQMCGDLFFRRISGMSMYKRIGRSPNSGAYIPDAADEIFRRGILPVTGEPYPHTFSQDGNWSTALPSGWETTAALWKAAVYFVSDQESGFRQRMDCRLGHQFGRSSHSIIGFAVTASGKWAYENSWGTRWGDLGKSIGYDSNFYSGYVYQPVLRDEVPVLLARELPVQRDVPAIDTTMIDAARAFSEKIADIKRRAEARKAEPLSKKE